MGWGWLVEGLAWFSTVSWWVILVGVLSKWVSHHHRQLLCGDVANLTASWIHIILCNYFHTYLADTTRSVAIWLKWFKRPVSPWCWIAAQFPPWLVCDLGVGLGIVMIHVLLRERPMNEGFLSHGSTPQSSSMLDWDFPWFSMIFHYKPSILGCPPF